MDDDINNKASYCSGMNGNELAVISIIMLGLQTTLIKKYTNGQNNHSPNSKMRKWDATIPTYTTVTKGRFLLLSSHSAPPFSPAGHMIAMNPDMVLLSWKQVSCQSVCLHCVITRVR